MNVYLTFDIEVWCNSWQHMDERFPTAFNRYVYGGSRHGQYALPKTLEILNRHGLKGVFFVEPLFAAHFGTGPLETIVALIREAGQEVQLHLHPEWTDEALQPLIENAQTKRQHLTYYSLEEQTALIGHGIRLLECAGSGPIGAFRAGSFAANRDTFKALQCKGIGIDSSLNRCAAISGPDLRSEFAFDGPLRLHEVVSYPVTVFRDGLGRERPAQVGACSATEMQQALASAAALGHEHFVIVSHNFEMLRAGSCQPDWVVVRRFERLCAHLAHHPDRFTVRGFSDPMPPTRLGSMPVAAAKLPATAWRYAEQARRRLPV